MSDLAEYIVDAELPVTERFDVYPEIDPTKHFVDKTSKGKVFLITGVSRGIGKELAISYAEAGASLIFCSRTPKTLEEVKQEVLRTDLATEVVSVVTDVIEVKQVEALVKAGVDRFGRLDMAIANAEKLTDRDARRHSLLMMSASGMIYRICILSALGEQDPFAWWSVLEVNLRGTHSLAHFTLPHLAKTNGYFVAILSLGSQLLVPNGSAYVISKRGVNRLIEFVALEHPNVKAFALHPGVVLTEMNIQSGFKPVHAIGLLVATTVYLTSGNAD
ncbi:hypothetical protein EWM64_g2669 [Hericium alpestre]|uniref:NAD(P)-binding protein n=1 Tax=Hericium alpestre TaxID=135208 RepID=A0A4Z0A4K7_9AGAM|nr:hypothetical protein EWM64_g2669 [Hericium alpestre]